MSTTEKDVFDTLVSYRPAETTICAEWTQLHQEQVLERILALSPNAVKAGSWRQRPRRRLAFAAIGVTAAGIVAAVGGIVLPANSPGGPETAIAAPFQRLQSAALHDPQPAVGAGQFSYLASESYTLKDGRLVMPKSLNKDWTTPNGDSWNWHSEDGLTNCSSGTLQGTRTFGNADQQFFDSLPTDPETLNTYMRSRVTGSNSKDEAVFVAVEDVLRTAGGLASTQLRAAFIGVLARTDHVTIREDARDALDRPATRVDFEDQKRRSGEMTSLYFAPSTSQLTQVQSSNTDGSGRRSVNVVTSQSIVDSLPSSMKSCPDYSE